MAPLGRVVPGPDGSISTKNIRWWDFCTKTRTRGRSGDFLNPGSGIGVFRIPDLSKKFYNSMYIAPKFFLHLLNNKIIFNFVIFVATKNGRTTNIFSPTMKTNVLAFFPNSDPYLLGDF